MGVRLVKFKEIAESLGDYYDKVVLRHLEFERTAEMIDAFDDFYDNNVDKPYDFPIV